MEHLEVEGFNLTKEEWDQLSELQTHPGWAVYQGELKRGLSLYIENSRKALTWDDHIREEAKASLLEERIIPLIPIMFSQKEE